KTMENMIRRIGALALPQSVVDSLVRGGSGVRPAGAIIGIVAGLVLGAIISWLAETFKDDIFEPQVAVLSLPTADATFEGGALQSLEEGLSFVDFGGNYTVSYTWALAR
ncbi:MAG: hypothetical protein ACRDJ9_24905, partial [Dehalococcoidia bacterium]